MNFFDEFFGGMEGGPMRTNRLDFAGDPYHGPDPRIFLENNYLHFTHDVGPPF